MCTWFGVLLLASSPRAFAQQEAILSSPPSVDRGAIREIERGFYFKSDIGAARYLNTHGLARAEGALLSGVLALGLGLGSDLVDRERMSMSFEARFGSALFDGPSGGEVLAVQRVRPLVQGDIYVITGTGALEISVYPSRRLGLGLRAGGGLLTAPLLVDRDTYDREWKSAWQNRDAYLHAGAVPLVLAGPSIEYYTKLSHFSVGVDVDVSYIVGFDLGISPLGYLKYTL